jgi:hypothetical protein
MGENPSYDAAKIFYQEASQLRIHWSEYIYNLMGYTFAFIGAIMLFGAAYYSTTNANPKYIVMIAATLCSITIGLWRWLTHYIDNQIVKLYPNMILYEDIIASEAEIEGPTHAYLETEIPGLEDVNEGNKQEAINALVATNRMGFRGHRALDIAAFILIAISIAIPKIVISEIAKPVPPWGYIIWILLPWLGLFFLVIGMCIGQKKPDKRWLENCDEKRCVKCECLQIIRTIKKYGLF